MVFAGWGRGDHDLHFQSLSGWRGLARSLKEEVPGAKWAWKQPFWASHGHTVMGPVGGHRDNVEVF